MYIEAVTVCVNYSEFLREVIPFNAGIFNRWLIVTDSKDEETKDLCHKHNLEFLATDDFYRDGAKFDKARGIDRGLQQLSHKDFVCHVDADVILPPHTRNTLHSINLDKNTIYGCDRVIVTGWERWQRLKGSGFLHNFSRSHHFNICFPGGYNVGARWGDLHGGWTVIGFFQLWHSSATMRKGIRTRRYSSYGHSDAARTDVQYSLLWDREHRQLIP